MMKEPFYSRMCDKISEEPQRIAIIPPLRVQTYKPLQRLFSRATENGKASTLDSAYLHLGRDSSWSIGADRVPPYDVGFDSAIPDGSAKQITTHCDELNG
jgi:hypothetical protein